MTFKELRTASGFTQPALAKASSVNVRNIQKIEAGAIRIGNITLDTAARLADALGVKIEKLLELE